MGSAVRSTVIDLRELRRLDCTSRWSLISDIWLPSRQRATSRTVANKIVTSGTTCFSRSVGLSLVVHLLRDCYRRRGGHESMSRAKTRDFVWLQADTTRHQPQSKREKFRLKSILHSIQTSTIGGVPRSRQDRGKSPILGGWPYMSKHEYYVTKSTTAYYGSPSQVDPLASSVDLHSFLVRPSTRAAPTIGNGWAIQGPTGPHIEHSRVPKDRTSYHQGFKSAPSCSGSITNSY